jgi:hypothetical protein
MPKATEEELLALKAKYLAAHSEYERCVTALSRAGLRSASTLPGETLDELARAFFELQVARNEYRAALFNVAFDSPKPLN